MIISSDSTNSMRYGQLIRSTSSSSGIPTLRSKRNSNSNTEGPSGSKGSSPMRNAEHQRNNVGTKDIKMKDGLKTEIGKDPLRRSSRVSSKLTSQGSPKFPRHHSVETSEKENVDNKMENPFLTRTTSVQFATANVPVKSASDRFTSTTNGPPTPKPLPKASSTFNLSRTKANFQSALTLGPSSKNLTTLGSVLRNTHPTTPAKGSSRLFFLGVSNRPSGPGSTQSSTILPMIRDLSRAVLADSLRLQTCSIAAGHPVQTVSASTAREINSNEERDSDLGSLSVSLSSFHLALSNGNNPDVPMVVSIPADEERPEVLYPREDSGREGDEGTNQYSLSTLLVTETDTKSDADETESILPSGVEVKKTSGPLIAVFQGTAYEAKVDIAKVGLPQCVSTNAIATDSPVAVNEAATITPESRPSVPMPPTPPSTSLADPASAPKRSRTMIKSTSSFILCPRLQNELASASATGHHAFGSQGGGRLEANLNISQNTDAGPMKTKGFGGMIIDPQAERTKKELANLRAGMGGSVMAKAKVFGRTIWSPASKAKDRHGASPDEVSFEMLPPAPFRANTSTNGTDSTSVNPEMPSLDWEDMSIPWSPILSARGRKKIIGCATPMHAVAMTRQLWKTKNFMLELE